MHDYDAAPPEIAPQLVLIVRVVCRVVNAYSEGYKGFYLITISSVGAEKAMRRRDSVRACHVRNAMGRGRTMPS